MLENSKRILREVRIMRHFSHPNIVRILHIQQPPDLLSFSDLYVVFECMDTDFAKVRAVLSFIVGGRPAICTAIFN